MTLTDYLALCALIVSVATFLYTGLAPHRHYQDAQLSQQAVLALERAYSALTGSGSQLSPPAADRLNWLTAARGIQDYKLLRKRLTTELYKQLCDANETHWRHQFHLALDTGNIYQKSYFVQGELEKSSVAVVFAFAAWPNNKPDPLNDVDVDSLFAESNVLRMNIGLRLFLGRD